MMSKAWSQLTGVNSPFLSYWPFFMRSSGRGQAVLAVHDLRQEVALDAVQAAPSALARPPCRARAPAALCSQSPRPWSPPPRAASPACRPRCGIDPRTLLARVTALEPSRCPRSSRSARPRSTASAWRCALSRAGRASHGFAKPAPACSPPCASGSLRLRHHASGRCSAGKIRRQEAPLAAACAAGAARRRTPRTGPPSSAWMLPARIPSTSGSISANRSRLMSLVGFLPAGRDGHGRSVHSNTGMESSGRVCMRWAGP